MKEVKEVIMRCKSSDSIVYNTLLPVFVCGVLFIVIVVMALLHHLHVVLEQQVGERLNSVMLNMAVAIESMDQESEIQAHVVEIAGGRGVEQIIVMEEEGQQIIAAADMSLAGRFVTDIEDAAAKHALLQEIHDRARSDRVELNDLKAERVIRIVLPWKPSPLFGRHARGRIYLRLSLTREHALVTLQAKRFMAISITLWGLVTLLLAFQLHRHLIRPAADIRRALQLRATGERNIRIRSESSGELGALAQTLDETLDSLDEAHEHFRVVAEVIPVGTYLTDIRGSYVYLNPQWEKFSGMSEAESLGDGWRKAIHPDDIERLDAWWKNSVASGKGESLDYRIVRPDGRVTWVLGRALRVMDDSGGLRGYVGSITDMTALRESELRAGLALGGAKLSVWDWNVTTGEINADERWFEMLGYQRKELEASVEQWRKLVHPEDLPRVSQIWAAHVEGRMPHYEIECRFRQRSGAWVWILNRGQIVEASADGHPLRTTGTCMDITDRIRRRNRLSLQNTVLKALAGNQPLEEVLNGICEQVEARIEGAVCSVMEFTGEGALKVIAFSKSGPESPDKFAGFDRGSSPASFGAAVHRSEPVFVSDTLTDPRWESLRDVVRESGVRACWSVPIRDGNQTFGVIAVLHFERREPEESDRKLLTDCANLAAIAVERHQVQQAMEESEMHFRTLADSGNALIWSTDTEKKCVYFNKVWLEFTGRSLMEELGDGWMAGVHPEDMEKCVSEFGSAVDRRESFTINYRLRRADGEYRWLEDQGTPRYNSKGEYLGYIGHCFDITERLATERQLNRAQRLESIGQLAGGVAHDLNNALAPILMGIAVLRRKNPGENDLIDNMESSARHGADMVRQLLSFSRGVEGERAAVQPRHLLEEMEKIIRGTFPKNIQLRTSAGEGLQQIFGDATQLHQVLVNLCVNARDAMPSGGVLTIAMENVVLNTAFLTGFPEAKPGAYVVFRVTDTGVGMSNEVQDRIFEPFYTTKGPEIGTGLGLSNLLGIVRSHGGFVKVESSPGLGSTFLVYLPAMGADGSKREVAPEADRGFRGSGEEILVVDDEPSVRQITKLVLTDLGFKVCVANDATAGLVHAAEEHAQLRVVITDLHMPDMDGVAFVRALKRMLPDIRIIVASGRLQEHSIKEFRELGVQAILEKPFAQEMLIEALQTCLQPGSQG